MVRILFLMSAAPALTLGSAALAQPAPAASAPKPVARDAFVKNIERNGLLHEADLLPDSYGGKFHPRAVPELVSSLPTVTTALARGKVTPTKALLHPHKASKPVKRIFKEIEGRDQRYELNLYVVGFEDAEDNEDTPQVPHSDEPTPLVPETQATSESESA